MDRNFWKLVLSVMILQIKKLLIIHEQKDSIGNFSDSTTWWAFTSRDGVIWMSTWNGTLYRFDPSHQNILHTDLYRKAD